MVLYDFCTLRLGREEKLPLNALLECPAHCILRSEFEMSAFVTISTIRTQISIICVLARPCILALIYIQTSVTVIYIGGNGDTGFRSFHPSVATQRITQD